MLYWYVILYIPYIYTVNPFYDQALGDYFFCDLYMYNHIPYKPL